MEWERVFRSLGICIISNSTEETLFNFGEHVLHSMLPPFCDDPFGN